MTTEDETVGWHHRLDGHKLEQAPGVGDGQGGPGVLQSKGSQRVGHVVEKNHLRERGLQLVSFD